MQGGLIMERVAEKNENLWLMVVSPGIWAAHFLLCYITTAVWCAKVVGREGPLGEARMAIAIYTVLALAGIGIVGWIAARRQSYDSETIPHAFDTPGERHPFLGFVTLLLSALSGVATAYVGLAAVFIQTCH
jgi:hypothetical protein